MTQQQTSTANEQYDLISALYHALEGAQTYATYVKDAEQGGDQELAQFFRKAQQEEDSRAQQAKQLLSRRMS
ncbi:MAG: hypothetical protein E6J34_16455 [Chloroflexi bacterium]|nr:MAG: hypothetical protein E6J34_16455 [Chloroflexota bacterium]